MQRWITAAARLLLMLGLGAIACVTLPVWADDFLAPEQAFRLTTRVVNARTLALHWDIAPGYHLYRDRISVQANDPDVQWAPLDMPPAKTLFDANFNREMGIYEHALDMELRLTESSSTGLLTVNWQGCADAGLCYPPDSATLSLPANTADSVQNTPVAPVKSSDVATDSIASTLASGSLLRTIGVFGLAGLLLAFTPCVLPMVPILSSLIAGQSGPVGRGRGFGLALAYSLGMALVYAGFGVAAGLAGEGLAAALQNPWVLGGFALMLSAMALSMFGFYDLQMPSVIQSRATEWSNRFQGGSYLGVFIMGGVSALVVGPCVAAPLAGALVYISQTRDVVLGGFALFAMALGMSVPLLLVGLSAGSLLPRAGAWMERVKQVFGMMLLGVAIWMVSPVLPATAHMLLWAAWLLTAAALLGIFGPATPQHSHTPVAARASGAAMATVSLILLVGAASGGQSVLQPLSHLRVAQGATNPSTPVPAGLKFERVRSAQALDAALAQAKQQGQTVMLDFYADWCVACKELETFTFSNPEVQKRLGTVRLLQADVTANNPDDKELLKRFNLFGPPGMVFLNGAANRVVHKVVGYQNAGDFLASLSAADIR